jgi:helicase
LRVEELPIDGRAKALYAEDGISELYPPQADAVSAGVLEGKSLVLAIPTASGKTLVAELCAIRHIMGQGQRGKVLYLVPLRALASEKRDEFSRLGRLGIKVVLSSGDYDSNDPSLGRYDLIIATNEKADSLFRHRPPWVEAITLVVADEVHLLGDGSRGPTLESLLTRLRVINPRAQVLALSATIRNADEIAAWLKAGLVTSSWRPVSLKEGVFCKGSIMFKDGEVRQVPPRQVRGAEKDPVADIAADTIKGGGQMLVFTGSRVSATSIAKRLEEPVRQLLKAGEERRLMELSSKLLGMGERTRLSEKLARSVSYGVAFHHAGLTYQQRKAVEDAFRAQLIKVISSTPTLAAGVNLPSRRVLIYDYKRYEAGLGRTNIPILEEKQMAGRAGRPRYDTVGEAILFSRTEEEREFLMEQYVLASPEKVWSKLGVASSLRSHILASVAMGLAHSLDGIFEFLDGSFCAYQYGMNSYRSSVLEAVSSLKSSGMIREEGKGLVPTPLGARVSELYIDPASAKVMLDGLRIRRSGLPSISYLTLVCHTPDMPKLYVRGKEAEQVMAYLQGNSDLLLYDLPEGGSFDYEMVLAEVKTALMLKDWVEESTEDQIVERFDIGSGDIHAYVESAKWLVHAAHELARLMGYHESAAPLRSLLIRIESGVKEELLPLISLRGVGRVRARALHTAGYRSIEDLRRAAPSDLGKLPQIGPETVKSIKEQVGGTVSKEEWSALSRGKGSKQLLIESYGEREEGGEEEEEGEENGKSEGEGGRGSGGG